MKKLLLTTSIIAMAGVSAPAFAQSLDYGTMQEMFGEPVTTSANGSPMRASDVPLDMTIITAEEIERYPATEIPDILRHYAGVSVRQNSSTEYSVGIRGYNTPSAERILVLVNGRQVFEDYFGLVNWSAIPVELNEIRQIEIVRGPNTALFGFNATSGVVNIVTHNPLYDDTDVAEADIGINSYERGSFIYTFQNEGEFGLRASLGAKSNDDDINSTNPLTVDDLVDSSFARNFNIDTALQLNDKTQMRVEVSHSKVDENIFDPYYDGYGRNSNTTSVRMNVSSDTEYGIIDATVYRNGVDVDYKNSSNGAGAVFNFDNKVTVAQLSDTFKIGSDHTFRIAGEYRSNETDHNVSLLGGDIGTTTLNISSLSTLWYWNITPRLGLSLAGRYDHVQSDFDGTILTALGNPYSESEYNNEFDEFGYNAGLVFKVTDADTIRLTAARGVDLPSSFELGFQGGTAWGNPNTDASIIDDFQLGYERRLSSIGGSLKTTAFYQIIDDQQGFLAGTPGFIGSIGDSKVFGGEISLNGMTDNAIRWGMNYSYSKIHDNIVEGVTVGYDNQNSNHIVNANIGYSPNEQWDMDLFGSYQSDFDQQRGQAGAAVPNVLTGVDPEFILDSRIAYKPFDKLTVSLNGRALFGDNEQSAYGEEVDRQIFLRAKYSF